MVVFDNLANSLLGLLSESSDNEIYKECRLLGQEANGSLTVCWITESSEEKRFEPFMSIGIYDSSLNELKVLHKFEGIINIIQASVNPQLSLLSYVTKERDDNEHEMLEQQENVLQVYNAFVIKIRETGVSNINKPQDLKIKRSKQIMVNFLSWNNKEKISKLLIFIHHESISLYYVKETDDDLIEIIKIDSVTRSFTWAQWDCLHQALYFIHFRKSLTTETDEFSKQELSPTLSCLQFHEDLPHETVLNIPLNLPSLPKSAENSCRMYEDDPIPLRIHDCSLDLLVVSNYDGIICICHHYLYQPVKPPIKEIGTTRNEKNTVHFAYSVTLLHHGCVIHCVVPGIPWTDAKTMRPTFILQNDQHLIVYAPGIFTHLLDVGLSHEPFCHVMMSGNLSEVPKTATRLVPLSGDFGGEAHSVMIDMPTMDLIDFEITSDDLIECFVNVNSVNNRTAILHYFLVHVSDLEVVEELLSVAFEKPTDLNIPKYLQEVLIGGAYISAKKNLPADATSLVNLLPISSFHPSGQTEVKINHLTSTITQEILWNTAVMLLSPQQRLIPYRADIWTKLWDQLAQLSEYPRFKHSQVADKLMVSLVCYQPEALSRCSTPMSPGASFATASSFADLAAINSTGSTSRKASGVDLPFYEIENCTASKQEHVISVNLRELSMHLLKNCHRQSPPHVHAVATRYVAAQLELSKQLCHMLTKIIGVDEELRSEKGFSFVQALDDKKRSVLFIFFQRYYYAVETLAYPLPQGFTSFFTYLGYKTLNFDHFLQYLQNSVFELQIDVMKEIMNETDDSKEGIDRKLRLLILLPRSRAKRLLNTWPHAVSLMIRAREHALNILSGVQISRPRGFSQARRNAQTSRGLAAFPSADRLSPLDTFLDLLTAKASLPDLDFNLLIEATISSTEEYF